MNWGADLLPRSNPQNLALEELGQVGGIVGANPQETSATADNDTIPAPKAPDPAAPKTPVYTAAVKECRRANFDALDILIADAGSEQWQRAKGNDQPVPLVLDNQIVKDRARIVISTATPPSTMGTKGRPVVSQVAMNIPIAIA
jgi:hypothetical protein